jgi:hypothetical protein
VLFTKRKKADRFIAVLLNGAIRPSGSVKYLEVILDAKLICKEHVNAKDW